MNDEADRVLCQTPTPGKTGTRIARWKYDVMRRAVLAALPADGPGIPFAELPALVEQALDRDTRERPGSISWYTTTVKLDLEVRGEIERVVGSHPQRLRRSLR